MKQSIKSSLDKRIQRISSGTFSCDDVKLLYIDLRDFSAKGSITREIGDYIAHPKEKDRGISHKRASDQYTAFKRMGDLLSGRCPGESDVIEVKPAFENDDIVNDIIVELSAQGFSNSKDLANHSALLGLCTITLLQDAKIKIDKYTLVEAGILFIDGVISLNVTYHIDYKGNIQAVCASLIQGTYKNDGIGKGTKSLSPGSTFNVEVVNGVPSLTLSN
jgi:hypothetical protein